MAGARGREGGGGAGSAGAVGGGGSFTSYFKATVMEYGALRSLGILFVHWMNGCI